MARTSASSRPLTDHDEIRRWAEERGATPSCVRGTGHNKDVGMIRLDFPGYSGEGKLEEISWDEWFDKFDESGLALLVQEKTARGQQSNFNKLVSRETAGVSGRSISGRNESSSSSGSKGRRNASRNNGFQEEEEEEEEYESSAEAIADQGTDEDLEEEILVEQASPTRARSTGTSRNRTRQARTTGRQASRNSRSPKASRRSGARTTRSPKQKTTKSRSSSSKRARTAAARKSSNVRSRNSRSSRSTARKPPSRTSASNPRSSRSSSRKRAA